MDGRYSISVPNKNDILIVSFLGYATEEIKINGRRNINIRLREDTKALDEVVVIGYGQQKKESVVVSMSSVKLSGNRPDSKFDQQSGRTSIRFNCRTTFR